VLDREGGQGVPGAGRGDQDARPDGGVGEVLAGDAVGVEDAGAEQGPGGLRSPGVPDDGDAVAVGAREQARLVEDVVEAVQDGVQVGDAHPQMVGKRGSAKPMPLRRESRWVGLDHDEPGGRPPVHEGLVAVHRPGVAVGEDDDGQSAPSAGAVT
jgi:hypothetical protein